MRVLEKARFVKFTSRNKLETPGNSSKKPLGNHCAVAAHPTPTKVVEIQVRNFVFRSGSSQKKTAALFSKKCTFCSLSETAAF